MKKRKGLREIEWGPCAGACNKICIYDNGHIDPEKFLEQVRTMSGSDVPLEARASLSVDDVKHSRFRPMSPTEAWSWGADSGVMDAEEGRGYAVTWVAL